MTDTPTPPAMTPDKRNLLIQKLRVRKTTISDEVADQLKADGVTIAAIAADRDALAAAQTDLKAADAQIELLLKNHNGLTAEIARLTAAIETERDRCMRIVSAARNGDIDQDMRALLHFMECGDQMVFDADKHEYIPDHVAKDRALIAAIKKGAAT